MAPETPPLDLLWQLLQIDSPSGDEGPMADWLMDLLAREFPDVRAERLGDSVLAVRGERPAVAVLAHLDTTGFTLGYKKALIPIGSPAPHAREPLRCVGQAPSGHRLTGGRDEPLRLAGRGEAEPGSRWVYTAVPRQDGEEIVAPYLDNRAGLWAALQTLARCERVVVAFTAGEETSGSGAFVCARRLYEGHGITQALIADITWDTAHVHCGRGVAISLRDRYVPRRRFLDRVLALAGAGDIPYQREIEDGGGSDGGSLLRSGFPIDWAFVGAPEKKPHSAQERIHLQDLRGMADMLVYLVNALSN